MASLIAWVMRQYREAAVLVVVIAVVALLSLTRRAEEPAAVAPSPAVAAAVTPPRVAATPASRVTVTPAPPALASAPPAVAPPRGGGPVPQSRRIAVPPLSIAGVRPGMSQDEVEPLHGSPRKTAVPDEEDGDLDVLTFGGRGGVRVCVDRRTHRVRRVEGRVLEAADGPLFERPVDDSNQIQAVFGVKPQQGQWDDIALSDGTHLEITRDDTVYFRLSR